jgi:hypothetical protein
LARTRRGTECQLPALKGKKRCRLHGGNAGAPVGNRNAFKHGLKSADHLAMRKFAAMLRKQALEL